MNNIDYDKLVQDEINRVKEEKRKAKIKPKVKVILTPEQKRERHNEYQRRYYKKNKAKFKKYFDKYYEENKDKIIQKHNEYFNNNRKTIDAYQKQLKYGKVVQT